MAEKEEEEEEEEDGDGGRAVREVLHTHAAVPLQHQTRLAGALEAAQCVQTVSVLADALDGALVDVCKITRATGSVHGTQIKTNL